MIKKIHPYFFYLILQEMLLQFDEYIWSCDLISAMAANPFLMFKFKKIIQSLWKL